MEYSGAGGNLIHEKNQKQKISWHCPFNGRGTLSNVQYKEGKSRMWVHNNHIFSLKFLYKIFDKPRHIYILLSETTKF